MNLKTNVYYKELEDRQVRYFKLFTEPERPTSYGQYQAKALTIIIHKFVNAMDVIYLIGEKSHLYLSEKDKYIDADNKDLRTIIQEIFERDHVNYQVL